MESIDSQPKSEVPESVEDVPCAEKKNESGSGSSVEKLQNTESSTDAKSGSSVENLQNTESSTDAKSGSSVENLQSTESPTDAESVSGSSVENQQNMESPKDAGFSIKQVESTNECEAGSVVSESKRVASVAISAASAEKILNNLGKTELWLAKNKRKTLDQLQKYIDETKEKMDTVKKILLESLSQLDSSPTEILEEMKLCVDEVFESLESLCKKALECHDLEMHAMLDDLLCDMKLDLDLSEQDIDNLTPEEQQLAAEVRMKKPNFLFREGPWIMLCFVLTTIAAVGIFPSSIFQVTQDFMLESSEFVKNITLF